MTTNVNTDQFLTELRDLLVKYNASINFSVGSCSDTHGLYDEKMVISVRPDPAKFKEVDILEVNGWGISAYDINMELSK